MLEMRVVVYIIVMSTLWVNNKAWLIKILYIQWIKRIFLEHNMFSLFIIYLKKIRLLLRAITILLLAPYDI